MLLFRKSSHNSCTSWIGESLFFNLEKSHNCQSLRKAILRAQHVNFNIYLEIEKGNN